VLENLLVFGVRAAHRHVCVFPCRLSYLLIAAFLTLHAVGLTTRTSEVRSASDPAHVWVYPHPFDRIVHFSFGLLMLSIREVFLRWRMPGLAYYLPLDVTSRSCRLRDHGMVIARWSARCDAWLARRRCLGSTKDMASRPGALLCMCLTALVRRFGHPTGTVGRRKLETRNMNVERGM